MKVLLIHPSNNKNSIAPGKFEPLSLTTLAATIPEHEVQIIDLRIDSQRKLDKAIRSYQPKVIGMTANNTIHVYSALRTLEHINNIYPEAKIVVGGHHPTMLPDDFRKPYVDAIFYGWAEKSFPAYIDALSNGHKFEYIQGIEILKDGKTVIKNKNQWDLRASEIPFPRRDLITKYLGKYRSDMGYKTSLVNTARGCPNRCDFCSVWRVTTGKFLVRDPEDVFHEIAALPDQVNRVFFADDNTFINIDNASRLAHLIDTSGIRKKYSGYCRSDTIVRHPELMKAWKKIGLDNLCVGFEVTDDQQLKAINKGNSILNNEAAARILNSIGIPFRPHLLISPSFEKKDFERITRYVLKHNLKSPIFPILTPIPGSDNYERVKNSIHLDYYYFDYAHAVIPTKLQPKDFYQLWLGLYKKSYSPRKNIMLFSNKKFAGIASNKQFKENRKNLRLINLFKLGLYYIYVNIKLIKHCRWEKKLLSKHPTTSYL